MELKKGQRVLIEAIVLHRCYDKRQEEEKGYVVKTSRGTVMVNPNEIYAPIIESRRHDGS